MGCVGFASVLGFGVSFDGLVSSGAAQVPGAPVLGFLAPRVANFLLQGEVLPDGFLSYFGEGVDYYWYGVGTQGGEVVRVEALAFLQAVYVRFCYEGVGVHGVYGQNGRQAGYECAECEVVAMGAHYGQHEPDEDHGDPEHEDGRVQAKFRQPELARVEVHALQRGGHDDEEEGQHRAGQRLEDDFVGAVFGSEQPVGEQEQREGEGGHRGQLEKAVAGVLGVGEAGGVGHVAGTAEEVTDLYYDEGEEQEVEEPEHDPDLDDAERDDPRTCYREVLGEARQQSCPDEPGRDPGEEAEE